MYVQLCTLWLLSLAVASQPAPLITHWLHSENHAQLASKSVTTTYWFRACNHIFSENYLSEIIIAMISGLDMFWVSWSLSDIRFPPYTLLAWPEDPFSNHWPSEEHMSCSSELIAPSLDSGHCAWTTPIIAITKEKYLCFKVFRDLLWVI